MQFNRLHACIAPRFHLLCCVNFRIGLHDRLASNNKALSFSKITLLSSVSTRSSLRNTSSTISSEVINPPIWIRLSALRELDSSIFFCFFASFPRKATLFWFWAAQHHPDTTVIICVLHSTHDRRVADLLPRTIACRASSNVNLNLVSLKFFYFVLIFLFCVQFHKIFEIFLYSNAAQKFLSF